jgi:lipoyl(octanoyl) transferase
MKVKFLGLQPYLDTWKNMQAFTSNRDTNTEDELWILEHHAVITQGISGKNENIISATNIPVISTDRGGQVTYHGPGQLVIYCLIDLKRLNIGVKKMVSIIEYSVINLLALYGIKSNTKKGAPGVYVCDSKIAALGLKVKNGRTYHGLSINVDMDLSPYQHINPCGYNGMKVTQLKDLTDNTISLSKVSDQLIKELINNVARN